MLVGTGGPAPCRTALPDQGYFLANEIITKISSTTFGINRIISIIFGNPNKTTTVGLTNRNVNLFRY